MWICMRGRRRFHERTLWSGNARVGGKAMSNRARDGLLLVALLAATAAIAAANPQPSASSGRLHSALQIKPGLWQFDDSAKVAGEAVFPDAVLAGVPEGQRAQHLAELRQMISRPSRERECITQAIFEQRLFAIETSCKRTVQSNTPARLEIQTECEDVSGSLKQHKTAQILATSSTSVTTSFHAVNSRAGKSMTIDSVENGHWLSSNCGNVHGIEQL
jgi:hypothetical protein